jgi:alpha/beta superfamily hydrolase
VRQSAVSFQVKGLTFEGVMVQPDGQPAALPGVVICHPHPLYGGNMDNNVVRSVSFALAEYGFATLRFNFRGVGNSQGEHTKGESEHHEVLGALDLMKAWPGVDGHRIGLAGYSFGTSVILRHSDLQKRAKAIALISPALQALESTALKGSKRPILVIAGDEDKLVQSEQLGAVLDTFSSPPTCHVVTGADHYWFGYEGQLAPQVVEFFAKKLK